MATTNVIQVNRNQTGNDLLKKLSRVGYTFADVKPDYVIGRTACALFLSIRYHALHPNYIYGRINSLGSDYELRVLLVLVDHVEHKSYLKELEKLTIRSGMTLMLAWTVEDAAMYLEKYKLFEEKPADSIMEKPTNHDYENALDQYMMDALAECKGINKTDAATIVGHFDTFTRIVLADPEELAICPGVGPTKAQRLHNLLNRNMRRDRSKLTHPSDDKQANHDTPESSETNVDEYELES